MAPCVFACGMDFKLATAAVVVTRIATATVVAVVTTAAEQEDKNDYPSTTTKAIITHNQDLLFCLSSHTMRGLNNVLQKNNY